VVSTQSTTRDMTLLFFFFFFFLDCSIPIEPRSLLLVFLVGSASASECSTRQLTLLQIHNIHKWRAHLTIFSQSKQSTDNNRGTRTVHLAIPKHEGNRSAFIITRLKIPGYEAWVSRFLRRRHVVL
jgi:hypothetical protein